MKPKKSVVIFRKFSNGEIIALFPYIVGFNHFHCMSYVHIGQHSEATLKLINETKLASKEEYIDLFNELTNSVGYNLLIKKKVNYKKYSNS